MTTTELHAHAVRLAIEALTRALAFLQADHPALVSAFERYARERMSQLVAAIALDLSELEVLRAENRALRDHYDESERRHARTLNREREKSAAIEVLRAELRALEARNEATEIELGFAHQTIEAITRRRDDLAAELRRRPTIPPTATCATCGGSPTHVEPDLVDPVERVEPEFFDDLDLAEAGE